MPALLGKPSNAKVKRALRLISLLAAAFMVDPTAHSQSHAIFNAESDSSPCPVRSVVAIDNVSKPAGNYTARFNIWTGSTQSGNPIAVTLEAFNTTTRSSLAKLDIGGQELGVTHGTAHTFDLPFEFDGLGKLELLVHIHTHINFKLVGLAISPTGTLQFHGSDELLKHDLGVRTNASWSAAKTEGQGYLSHGPGAYGVPPGVATATFTLQIDDISGDNDIVAVVDVYDAASREVLAHRRIKRKDFMAPQLPQGFDLEFEVARPAPLEFRIFTQGSASLRHLSTMVMPDRQTLSALWNARAHWEFLKRDLFVSKGVQDYATSSLIALDGNWYAFNRVPANNLDLKHSLACTNKNSPPLAIVVRRSADRGRTWSEPVLIASPSSSTSSPDFCEIVDGAAYFDSEEDVWHYLAQCVNPPADWGMCHYTRAGSSPMGGFTADPANPVVAGGQLWSKICAGSGKSCPSTMKDEGTPQIISKSKDGFFYVSFHGADHGPTVTGARGVARTADFVAWQTAGGNLPGDAMLTSRDCNVWNAGWGPGGCIGEGDAHIIRSNGNYYLLAEAADKSLNCQAGQKWVFGLLRNAELGPSGTWQNYAANPIIVDDNTSPSGCDLEYMNFIRDRGEIYLEFSLYSPDFPFPNYTYHLVEGPPRSETYRVK